MTNLPTNTSTSNTYESCIQQVKPTYCFFNCEWVQRRLWKQQETQTETQYRRRLPTLVTCFKFHICLRSPHFPEHKGKLCSDFSTPPNTSQRCSLARQMGVFWLSLHIFFFTQFVRVYLHLFSEKRIRHKQPTTVSTSHLWNISLKIFIEVTWQNYTLEVSFTSRTAPWVIHKFPA